MPNGEAFGGAEWIEQLVSQLVQAMMGAIDWSELMGYGYPSMYKPQPPTHNDMLMAIWENRSDIRAYYEEMWGDPAEAEGDLKNWRPEDAVENWLAMTPELDWGEGGPPDYYTPPVGVVETPESKARREAAWAAGKKDPMAWAIEQGYIVDYSAEGAVATLERDMFEQKKQEWSDTQLRLAGLDEEAIRQFNASMALYRDEFDEAVRNADRDYLRQMGLDEESIRRWDKEQDRIEALDAEAIREANRQFLRAEGLDEEAIRQFNADHALAVLQNEQYQANVQWEHLRLAGLDEQAAYEFQQTHGLAVRQFEEGNDQWWATFDFEREKFNVETGQWEKAHALDVGYFGLAEDELELLRLQTMLGFTGPADWPQYWAASQAMPEAWGPAGEPIPAWAQTLAAGESYSAFGAPGQVPEGMYGGILPWQVSPEQWASLTPSEMSGLGGQVQTGGGWMPDWMRKMQQSWPTGQATPISYFGG